MAILPGLGGTTAGKKAVKSFISTLLVKLDNRCLCHLSHYSSGVNLQPQASPVDIENLSGIVFNSPIKRSTHG